MPDFNTDIENPAAPLVTSRVERRRGPGRPKLAPSRRQSLPVEPGKTETQAQANLPTGAVARRVVPRRRVATRVSIDDLDYASGNLPYLLDVAPEVFADYSAALNFYVQLVNPGFTLRVKNPGANGSGYQDDPEGTKIARDLIERTNCAVDSEIPGATGGSTMFLDTAVTHLVTRGAVAIEDVLDPRRSRVEELCTFDPLTVEFEEDPGRRGKYLLFQRQPGTDKGRYRLNPNLVTYRAWQDELHGRALFAPAHRVLPYWMRYWADLQIFLHNAAFGFLDAELDHEALQEMWSKEPHARRKRFNDDFMTWALAVLDKVMQDYNDSGERDPDAVQGHLSILKLSSKGTAGATFPAKEAREVLKREVYSALKVPPALMGEPVPAGGEAFSSLQVQAFVATILKLRKLLVEAVTRALVIAFRVMGYQKEVVIDFRFHEVKVDDHLKSEQARQLQLLNDIKLRDENAISQNEFAERCTGTPALGPAPLSRGADPDGPSAPSEDVLLARFRAKEPTENASASGPSFGGAKNGDRDTDPAKDNRT